jgi:hypothetical protein
MRPQVDAIFLGGLGHVPDVGLEEVDIHHHARRRQNFFGDSPEIAARDSLFEFIERKRRAAVPSGPNFGYRAGACRGSHQEISA